MASGMIPFPRFLGLYWGVIGTTQYRVSRSCLIQITVNILHWYLTLINQCIHFREDIIDIRSFQTKSLPGLVWAKLQIRLKFNIISLICFKRPHACRSWGETSHAKVSWSRWRSPWGSFCRITETSSLSSWGAHCLPAAHWGAGSPLDQKDMTTWCWWSSETNHRWSSLGLFISRAPSQHWL